jgi:hypothetical protein
MVLDTTNLCLSVHLRMTSLHDVIIVECFAILVLLLPSLTLSSPYSPKPCATVVLFRVTLLVASPIERERLQYGVLWKERGVHCVILEIFLDFSPAHR